MWDPISMVQKGAMDLPPNTKSPPPPLVQPPPCPSPPGGGVAWPMNNKKSMGNHRRRRNVSVGYTRIQMTVVWCPSPPWLGGNRRPGGGWAMKNATKYRMTNADHLGCHARCPSQPTSPHVCPLHRAGGRVSRESAVRGRSRYQDSWGAQGMRTTVCHRQSRHWGT